MLDHQRLRRHPYQFRAAIKTKFRTVEKEGYCGNTKTKWRC